MVERTSKPRRSEQDIFDRNLFGLSRLLLACAVIFGHVWVVNYSFSNRIDPILRITHDLGTGQVAVIGFFAISGFLISGSSRRNSTRAFLIRRAGRLLPGYWLMLVFVSVAFEPTLFFLVHSTLRGLPVLGSHSIFTYAFKNSFLVELQAFIPGIVGHGMQPQVNGSAWSLPYEASCYLAVATIVWAGRRLGLAQWVWVPAAGISVGLFVMRIILSHNVLTTHLTSVAIPLVLYVDAFFISYTIGCFGIAWLTRTDVRILVPALFTLVVALGHWEIWGELLFPLLMLVFASCRGGTHTSDVGRKVDLSYGIYLFAWPVQQVLATKHLLVSYPYLNFVVVLVGVIPIAFASWCLVERPSHQFMGRWASRLNRKVPVSLS